jgi:hypothetical protein
MIFLTKFIMVGNWKGKVALCEFCCDSSVKMRSTYCSWQFLTERKWHGVQFRHDTGELNKRTKGTLIIHGITVQTLGIAPRECFRRKHQMTSETCITSSKDFFLKASVAIVIIVLSKFFDKCSLNLLHMVYVNGLQPGVRQDNLGGSENVLHQSKQKTVTSWTLNQLWTSHSRRFVPELRCCHARNKLNILTNS